MGEGVEVVVPDGFPRPDNTHVANGNYLFKVKNKYNITDFKIAAIGGDSYVGVDIGQLGYLPNLQKLCLTGHNCVGNVQNFANVNVAFLDYFEFYYSNIEGDMDSLQDFTALTSLYYQNVGGVYGDIGSLYGKMIKLNNSWFYGTNMTGTIESVVEAQCANGRTSGTLLLIPNSIVTLNAGNTISGQNYNIVFSEIGATISISDAIKATYTKNSSSWVYA